MKFLATPLNAGPIFWPRNWGPEARASIASWLIRHCVGQTSRFPRATSAEDPLSFCEMEWLCTQCHSLQDDIRAIVRIRRLGLFKQLDRKLNPASSTSIAVLGKTVILVPHGVVFAVIHAWLGSIKSGMILDSLYRMRAPAYTPCPKKTKQICFCQNFVKFAPILIIFGRKMGNDPYIYARCTHFPPHLICVTTLPC